MYHTLYIQCKYNLHLNIKIIDTDMILESNKRESTLRVKKWELVHSDFSPLNFKVELLETSPNAKH